VNYTYVPIAVKKNLHALEGMVEAGNNFSWIGFHGMAQTDEYLYGGRVLAGFEHADIFPRNAGSGGYLFLG
jgi:hypothetical protein